MRYSLFTSMLLMTSLTLTGCSQFQSFDAAEGHASQPTATTASSPAVYDALHASYRRYEGTPYVFGGTTAKGFDCSGFINKVYAEALQRSIPRTTDGIADSGVSVRRTELAVGDIVLFRTSVKQLHAGIYMGNDNFIHASTSKGVIQSSLRNSYWQTRYIGARRYL